MTTGTILEGELDEPTKALARFSATVRWTELSPAVVHHAKRRIVDALGCAVGGVDAPPAMIAREIAREHTSTQSARVLGLAGRSSPEMAAFANGVMVRYLDFNDGFGSPPGHPSDMIFGVLAVADAIHAPGPQAILGVIAAYETNRAIKVPFNRLGWDHGITVALGVAAGVAVVLGLSEGQVAQAIALAIAPSIPLRVTRSGELSHWKGAATAAAARHGVFAASLAAKGMTGPNRVFDGRNGLWQQVSGPFEVDINPARDGYAVELSNLKSYPAAHMTHAVIHALLELSEGLTPYDVESIEVRTYANLIFESGGEPEKWDPKTRETADHSLPYVMASALRDRALTVASYADAAISDPALRPLMQQIRVVEEPAFTLARGDQSLPADDPARHGISEVEITTRSGDRRVARTGIPRGHHLNPMSDGEIEAKFRGLVAPQSSLERADRALAALWAFDLSPDTRETLDIWGDLVSPRTASDA